MSLTQSLVASAAPFWGTVCGAHHQIRKENIGTGRYAIPARLLDYDIHHNQPRFGNCDQPFNAFLRLFVVTKW
jgi:hypothetical protein